MDDAGDSSPTTLSIEEALDLGVQLHRSGEIVLAETVYRRILETLPDQAETMHHLGILHHRTGRSDEAVALIRQALSLRPNDVAMHNNLGNVLAESGRVEEAVSSYGVAVALEPTYVDALNNMGVSLRALSRLGDAEAAYRRVIAIDPEYREAHDNLGRLLASVGRTEEAIACHRRALDLEPRNSETRGLLTNLYAMTGERDQALAIVDAWLADEPANAAARHLRAAISGRDVPDRASDRYVASLFNAFAATFDCQLASLDYRAPELTAAALRDVLGAPAATLTVLDAGCGTGLCGPLVLPYARRLDGVDLSEQMLQRARERGVYHGLWLVEITRFLGSRPAFFDVILSADTLCYFGCLATVAAALRAALRPGGVAVFTLEEEAGPAAHVLNLNGRYSHRSDYVAAVIAETKLSLVSLTRDVLRTERGKPVAGLVVTVRV